MARKRKLTNEQMVPIVKQSERGRMTAEIIEPRMSTYKIYRLQGESRRGEAESSDAAAAVKNQNTRLKLVA